MIDDYVNKIINNLLFLKLKNVVENNAYHNHEDVYSHSIKTKDIAKREIEADFITNPKAKKLFLEFVNEDFQGMRRADIMILIALLHDIGKILTIREGDIIRSIVVTDSSGITSIPGHEYWGSTIVGKILQDLTLEPEVISYIANIIRLHDTFNDAYFNNRKGWTIEALINDAKSKAEGLYKETMFNMYCDGFTAKPWEYGKKIIVNVFNNLSLYTNREYVIT